MLRNKAMREIFRQNTSMFFRGTIMFAVLASLLFSRGEGIRLLPFPSEPAGQTLRDDKLRRENDFKIAYQKNFHRFEKYRLNHLKSSQQTDDPQHFADLRNGAGSFPSVAANVSGRRTENERRSRLFKPLFSPADRSSRAPPFSLMNQL